MAWVDCADAAATLHAHLCEHDWHGYTQGGGRWGDGGSEEVDAAGGPYTLATGDRDCSSSICDVWQTVLARTPYAGSLDGATYTGNMRSVFVNSGLFDWHDMGDGYVAQRGDIYLNEASHTALCQYSDPDTLSEFCINEYGTITGGAVGDQTGSESRIANYYNFPWDGVLAYNHNADYDTEDDVSAEDVWNFNQNGVLVRDRLQGTDEAANAANVAANEAKNAANDARAQLTRTDDVSGRGTEANLYERMCWMGARTAEISDKLDELIELLKAKAQ